MADKILVVDDETEIADLIEFYLKSEGYQVYKCYNGRDASALIQKEAMDLAILDVMLPDTDGFGLCRQIRKRYNYPVIMLTAKDEEVDKVMGLSLGADDYMTKPFRPLELTARVKAQLRRYKRYNPALAGEEDGFVMEQGGLTINVKTHQCTLNGQELNLTPTEFTILRILCEKKGKVISGEDLFHEVWNDAYYNKSNNTISVHIRHLREKMGDSVENPKYIKTIWGVGYKMEG